MFGKGRTRPGSAVAVAALALGLLSCQAAEAKEAFVAVEGGIGFSPEIGGSSATSALVVPIRVAGFYHGDSDFGAEYGLSFPRAWLSGLSWLETLVDDRSTTVQGLNLYGGPSFWPHDRVELGVPLQAGVGLVSATETSAGCFLSAAGQVRTFFVLDRMFPLTLSLTAEYAFVLTPGAEGAEQLRMLSVYTTLGIWMPTQ